MHLQLLSEELVLHVNSATGTSVTLPILKQSMNSESSKTGGTSGNSLRPFSASSIRDTVMLKTKCKHQNISIDELNSAWVHGRVDWLPQTSPSYPNIMYCDSNKTGDVKSVDITKASSCPQLPCSCLNPWEPIPLVLQPGDFVELRPAEGQHTLDSYNRLGRVVNVNKETERLTSNAAAGPSSNILDAMDALKPRPCGIYTEIFSLQTESSQKTTHDFVLQERRITVPMKNVLRKIDLHLDLPRGVRILDGNGEDILSTPTPSPPPPPLECIDLFCGMGGLSIGLEASGAAEVIVGVDGFRAATETFQGAHPNADVACEDVCKFLMRNTARLLKANGSSGKNDAAEKGKPSTIEGKKCPYGYLH